MDLVNRRSKNGHTRSSSNSPANYRDSSVDSPRGHQGSVHTSPCGASTDRELSADVTTPQKCRASSIDSLRDVQVPRLTSAGRHPCAHDYDDVTKEYIAVVCTLFHVKISTSQGFPDVSQELLMAREVWHEVGEQLKCSLHLSHRIAKLVRILSLYY